MLVIKIVGGEQVVCDCKGDTVDTWMDKLLVGISETEECVTVTMVCPECDSSMKYEIILGPHLNF